jgi:hypothetical protein
LRKSTGFVATMMCIRFEGKIMQTPPALLQSRHCIELRQRASGLGQPVQMLKEPKRPLIKRFPPNQKTERATMKSLITGGC